MYGVSEFAIAQARRQSTFSKQTLAFSFSRKSGQSGKDPSPQPKVDLWQADWSFGDRSLLLSKKGRDLFSFLVRAAC